MAEIPARDEGWEMITLEQLQRRRPAGRGLLTNVHRSRHRCGGWREDRAATTEEAPTLKHGTRAVKVVYPLSSVGAEAILGRLNALRLFALGLFTPGEPVLREDRPALVVTPATADLQIPR